MVELPSGEEHSSFFGPLVNYEENEMFRIFLLGASTVKLYGLVIYSKWTDFIGN
jgi:hypothetical protein